MPRKVVKRAAEEAKETVKKAVGRLAEEPTMLAKSIAAQLGFTKEDLETNPYFPMTPQQRKAEEEKEKQQERAQIQELEEGIKAYYHKRIESQPTEEELAVAEAKKAEEEKIPPPPVTGEKKKRGLAPWIPHRARQKMGTAEVTPGAHG